MGESVIAIIAALITGTLSLLGTVYTVKRQHDKTITEVKAQMEIQDVKLAATMDKNQAVTDVKLEELTREVRKHNGFAETVPKLELRLGDMDRRIQTLEQKAG